MIQNIIFYSDYFRASYSNGIHVKHDIITWTRCVIILFYEHNLIVFVFAKNILFYFPCHSRSKEKHFFTCLDTYVLYWHIRNAHLSLCIDCTFEKQVQHKLITSKRVKSIINYTAGTTVPIPYVVFFSCFYHNSSLADIICWYKSVTHYDRVRKPAKND